MLHRCAARAINRSQERPPRLQSGGNPSAARTRVAAARARAPQLRARQSVRAAATKPRKKTMPKGPSKSQQKFAQRQALARQEAAYDAEPEVIMRPRPEHENHVAEA